MPESSGTTADLVRYRFGKSEQRLKYAEASLKEGSYDRAAIDAYYAIFNAVLAAQALSGNTSVRSHKGVIINFSRTYIKTGIVPADFGHRIWRAFEARQSSDYEDFFEMEEKGATKHVATARELLGIIEPYCLSVMGVEEDAPETEENGDLHPRTDA